MRCPIWKAALCSGSQQHCIFHGMPVVQGNRDGMRKLKLKIEDPPRRKHTVFLGGAVLADIMKDKRDFWVSKAEYEEDPHRALKKCCSL